MVKTLVSVTAATCLILGFQNCGKFEGILALNVTQSTATGQINSSAASSVPWSVPENNLSASLSWDESATLKHLLMEFERTRDQNKLGEFIARAKKAMAARDDIARRYSYAPTWSYYARTNDGWAICSNSGIDGLILSALGRLLYLRHSRPDLFTNLNLAPEEINTLVKEISDTLQKVLAYHRQYSWNSAVGNYKAHSNCPEVDSRGREMRYLSRLPFNLTVPQGLAHLYLYLQVNDSHHLAMAKAIAEDLSDWFEFGSSGELFWPYFYLDSSSEAPEDLSHGALVAEMIRIFAENGIIFNNAHVLALDKTVRYFILSSSNVLYHYIGQRKDVYYSSAQCHDTKSGHAFDIGRSLAFWMPITPYKSWQPIFKSFISTKGNGSVDLLIRSHLNYYSRNKIYGDQCSYDGECTTNSCYGDPSGRRICGNKLSNSSTCYKDSDCASGICYAGKVCAGLLGSTSTCYRHHECLSGVCGSDRKCM